VRFLAAVKNRLKQWKKNKKFRPTLSHHTIEKVKEVRKIRNKYYHLCQKRLMCEETRVFLRVLSRAAKNERGKYKAAQRQKLFSCNSTNA